MRLSLLFFSFLLFSCSQISRKENSSSPWDSGNSTVSVEDQSSSESKENINQEANQESKSGEFSPYAIKANRNKKISIFIGKLSDKMFYAIGAIKWLERNGYKIKKVQTTSSEEDQLFSVLKENKKTSHIEWQLHQCCLGEFPFEDENSYKEVIKKLELKVLLPRYSQDQNGCLDFASENQQDHVLCLTVDKKNNTEVELLDSGMHLINITFGNIDYSENLSLVDYIERGFTMAQRIKK